MRLRFSTACLLLLSIAASDRIQAQANPSAGTATERAFRAAKNDPAALRAFLQRMPKGGDLHIHLTGAIYAENFIDAAAHGLVCLNKSTMSFVAAKASSRSIPPQPVCGEDLVRASDALKDQKLYDTLVDSFSMRDFVPSAGISGHDQFFATFNRFSAAAHGYSGRWVDEIATRASSQNEQYVEIMHTPDLSQILPIALKVNYTGDAVAARASVDPKALARAVAAAHAEFAAIDADRNSREYCDTPQASAACKVQVRYLFQVLRAQTPAAVLVETLVGMELASADPQVVGINFVQPEDTFASMTQYSEEMKMIGDLHPLYPKAHLSLHAGELAMGLVPPEGLRSHIREAVEVAHAERIGHGVDVMYEDDADGLLREMAAKHILVEINLTSNDVILGISGKNHPLTSYRAAGVPVALSTDDEGVSRIDLTHEYVRAVLEQGLTYRDLRTMARASLEHSFMSQEDKATALHDFDIRVKTFESSFSTGAKKR